MEKIEMKEYLHKIIELYTKNNLGEDSKEEFFEWLIDDEMAEHKKEALFDLWCETDSEPTTSTLDALAELKEKAAHQDETSRRGTRPLVWQYAAAVAVVAVIGVTSFFLGSNMVSSGEQIEFYTRAGETETIQLPDGSTVHTNSRTLILYSEDFGTKDRSIYISGEANFKVAKNEKIPFVVHTNGFSITALGTTFNVSSNPDDKFFRTTLVEGSVRIDSKQNENSFTLTKSEEQFSFDRDKDTCNIALVDLDAVTAWQRGELIFRSATIDDVLMELERNYDVTFQYRSNTFNQDKFNFRFSKESNVDDVMEIINAVESRFTYNREGDVFYIR